MIGFETVEKRARFLVQVLYTHHRIYSLQGRTTAKYGVMTPGGFLTFDDVRKRPPETQVLQSITVTIYARTRLPEQGLVPTKLCEIRLYSDGTWGSTVCPEAVARSFGFLTGEATQLARELLSDVQIGGLFVPGVAESDLLLDLVRGHADSGVLVVGNPWLANVPGHMFATSDLPVIDINPDLVPEEY